MRSLNQKVAQPFESVNTPINSQLPLIPGPMTHHNPSSYHLNKRLVYTNDKSLKRYGVSRSRRVLSPQLLLRKFDQVRDFLEYSLGLTVKERTAVIQLLRFWAYYGAVYCKESQVTAYQPVSKATYWRAIRRLRALGLVEIVNRYVIRPHAQISNIYRLDKLMIVLARYLRERGTRFLEKWLLPYFKMPGQLFWSSFLTRSGVGVGGSPGPAADRPV